MRRGLLIGALAGALALGAACGGDDDGGDSVSAEAQPYVDSLKEAMTSGGSSDLVLTDEQADCLAPKFVDAIGVDTLTDAGIEPDDLGSSDSAMSDVTLTDAQAQGLTSSFGECDVSLKDMFIDSMAESGDLSDEDKACIEREFPDDLLENMIATTMTKGEDALEDDEDLMSQMFAVFAKCPGLAGG